VKNFSVSEATARRDLESLAANGKLQRFHGGAILLAPAPREAPILQRQNERQTKKQGSGNRRIPRAR